MESPIKHYILGNITPTSLPHSIPSYNQQNPFSAAKEVHHELPETSTNQIDTLEPEVSTPHNCELESFDQTLEVPSSAPEPLLPSQAITNMCNPSYQTHGQLDKATICVGLNKQPPVKKNLDSVIETLNSQLDVVSTEIRDKINELSTITPEPSKSPQANPDKSKEVKLPTVESDLDKLSTSHMMDELYPENIPTSPSKPSENKASSPQGLTIEELEPISAPKPKRKQKRNNSQKEDGKRRKKSESLSGNIALSSEKAGCSTGDGSQGGETEYLSNIQRVLTSNMMSTNTQPKKARAPRPTRKKSVPMISLDEQTLMAKMAEDTNTQPSVQEDPTLNSKLLTELQRLLTQNNIRTALQGEKKKRKCTRPSLDSPPYIRPPQLHDSTSMDGSRFTLVLDKPRMFPCLQCNKEFKTKQCLKRHISRHLGVKLHVCSYCNKRFNDKSNMKRHVVTHINVRKFTCDVCDQAFFRKEVMELHKRRLHTIPNDILSCRFKKCGFTCKIPYKLVEHIQTVHFHNYKYNCDKCSYKTQHNVNYLKHLRVHTGDRPFKCPKCGKGFKQRNALKKHSYVHLDRPHKCEICLKTFCLELALRIHYENNHGPRAAQKKLHEKRKREILRKYRQQRSVHSKKISFVNVMPTKL